MRCIESLFSFFAVLPLGFSQLGFRCVWALPYAAAPAVGGVGTAV